MKKKTNRKAPQLPSHRIKKAESRTSFFESNYVIYTLLGFVVLFIIIARANMLSFPLERDEGEYAYMGKLILDGHVPYTIAYNMKYPGTYYMYAGIMAVFGKTVTGIHLGLLTVVVASVFLMFLISRHFVSKISAVIAAASFGIIGTSHGLLGQAAHATHFVTFFALLGIYFLLQTYKNEKYKALKYLLSGVFFSFAFISKQSGLFFVFFGYTVIIIKDFMLKPLRIPWKNLLFFTTGFITPVFLMFLTLLLSGLLEKFWFWTFTYLSIYGAQVQAFEIFDIFKQEISSIMVGFSSKGYVVLWVIALIGILIIFKTKKTKEKQMILYLFLFSFLTVIPGFYFRNHYFITMLPVIALLIGLFFDYFNQLFLEKFKNHSIFIFVSFLVFLIVAGHGVNANKDYLFNINKEIICKKLYTINPFVESMQIGKYIKQNSTQEDKIAIFGSEPQILFYADRYSATGYLYTYSLMENNSYANSMQMEMIKEIEQNKPKFFVFVNIGISWLQRNNSDLTIFTWAEDYIKKHYKIVGFMDISPDKIAPLKFQFDDFSESQGQTIFLFERRE